MTYHRFCRSARSGVALLTLGALAAWAPVARAIAPIGDDMELFVTGAASFTATDNLFLTDTNTHSDTIWDLTPGLELDYGRHSLFKGNIVATDDFQFYGKDSKLNTNLAGAAVKAGYNDGVNNFSLVGSYTEAIQPTETIRVINPSLAELVKRDVANVNGSDEYQAGALTSISGGVQYADTHYRTAGYSNLQIVTIPVNYYYKIDPKLDVTGGLAYADNTVGRGGVDSQDYFFNVGVRDHAFTPKLSGQVLVGYTLDSRARGGNDSTFGLSAQLAYAYSEITNFTLLASNNFGYNALGSNYREASVTLGESTNLDKKWTVGGTVSFSRYQYLVTTQVDDYYQLGANVAYNISSQFSVGLRYSYFEDNSNLSIDSFKQNLVQITASVRF